MKYLLICFFFLCFLSCKNKPEERPSQKQATTAASPIFPHTENTKLPNNTEEDSGYFKGSPPEKIDLLEPSDNTAFFTFLQNNLGKKDIVLLNKEALSNSVMIDPKKHIRIDTLTNGYTSIISVYKFDKYPSQDIYIDGKRASHYQQTDVDSLREDILGLDASSFRYFYFKGKQYYYIRALIADRSGGSIALLRYHLIYDLKNKTLLSTITFRVDDHLLFGDVDGDDRLDILSIDNDGGYGITKTNKFSMQLLSITPSGKEITLKDNAGKEYFIEGNTGEDYYVGKEFNIDKSYWPVKLK